MRLEAQHARFKHRTNYSDKENIFNTTALIKITKLHEQPNRQPWESVRP